MSLRHILSCLLLSAGLIATSSPLRAQGKMEVEPSRFQREAVVVGVGVLPTCLDTYLSPNRYVGLLADIGLEQWKCSRWGDGRLYAQWFSHTTLGITSGSGSSSEMLAMEDLSYAMPWQCVDTKHFRLYAGGEFQARLGGVWNPRNSNNPANAKAGTHLGGMAMAEFRYHLGKRPVRSSVTFDMPLVGAFFSPEYTESYYELFYVGGTSPCIHLATPANCLSGRGRVQTDITLRGSILRLSLIEDNYRWQTATNRYALHSYSLGVGFVFNSYRIRPNENAASHLPY